MQQVSKGGRPPLPKRERKSGVHAFRLDASGEKMLRALKRKLDVANDSDAVRAALEELARKLGVAS